MTDRTDEHSGPRAPWRSGTLVDVAARAQLAEINAYALELIAAPARADPVRDEALLVAELREAWRALSPDALRRIASAPYLLVDAGFGDGSAWAAGWRVHDGGTRPWFPGEAAARLASLCLTWAWHLARTDALAARLLLGAAPEAVQRLAVASLSEIAELQPACASRIRPRWADRPAIWQALLRSAGEVELFPSVRLRGLQLIAAESILPPTRR
jgi:hypothetical protein